MLIRPPEKRYSHGSRILEKDAFESLVQAYVKAEEKNLVECTLLKVCVQPEQYQEVGRKMVEKMRDSDINSLYSKKAAQRNVGPTTGHKSITIAFIHVLRFFSFPLKWFQIT